MPFLEPDDVVEVPTFVHGGGLQPLATGEKMVVRQVGDFLQDAPDEQFSGRGAGDIIENDHTYTTIGKRVM